MTKSERDQSFPDSEPRDAATLMLIDRSGPSRKCCSAAAMPATNSCRQIRLSGRPHRGARRDMSSVSELHPDTEKKLNERVATPGPAYARAFALAACARWRRRLACCSASNATNRRQRGRDLGRVRQGQGATPTSATSISLRAPSRRRAGRAVSTRAFSPPTPPPSPTRSKAWSGRSPNWSSSPGSD